MKQLRAAASKAAKTPNMYDQITPSPIECRRVYKLVRQSPIPVNVNKVKAKAVKPKAYKVPKLRLSR